MTFISLITIIYISLIIITINLIIIFDNI